MSSRMDEDLGILEGGQEVSAHVIRDDFIFKSKDMQGGDLQSGAVEFFMFFTQTTKAGDEDGEAKDEFRRHFLLLKRAEHGDKSRSLTEAQHAVKRTVGLHGLFHSRHALLNAEAFLALLESIETAGLRVRKPPASGVLLTSGTRTGTVLSR